MSAPSLCFQVYTPADERFVRWGRRILSTTEKKVCLNPADVLMMLICEGLDTTLGSR